MGLIVAMVFAYAVFIVGPFKLAAAWLGADRTDWISCFIAVVVAGILGGGAFGLLGGTLAAGLLGVQGLASLATVVLVTGLVNQIVLGTTFVRGVFITLIGAMAVPVTLLAVGWVALKARGG